MQQLAQWVQQFVEAHRGRVHGFATLAVNVGGDGVPHDVRMLIDRVLPLPGAPSSAAITTHAGQQLSALRFDATEGESTAMVPLVFT